VENRVKRAVIMAEGKKATPEDLELVPSSGKYEGKGPECVNENETQVKRI